MKWLIHAVRLKVQENSKAVKNCERPKCAACAFVKFHCKSNTVNIIKNNTMKKQEFNNDHLLPKNMVSTDHYISRAPGRLYHTKVKSYLS